MSGHALTIVRHFKGVPPERVYACWTDPGLIAQWFGPEGFTNTIHEMNVVPGGAYRLTMCAPDGATHPLRGTFVELSPPRRVVFTWQWADADTPASMGNTETLVTVTIAAKDGGAEMIMVHERFADETQVQNHTMGWTSSFEKLARTMSA